MSQDIRRSIHKLCIYILSFNSQETDTFFFSNYPYNGKTLRYRSNKIRAKYVCLKLQNHERNQERHKKMKSYTMFMDWELQYG